MGVQLQQEVTAEAQVVTMMLVVACWLAWVKAPVVVLTQLAAMAGWQAVKVVAVVEQQPGRVASVLAKGLAAVAAGWQTALVGWQAVETVERQPTQAASAPLQPVPAAARTIWQAAMAAAMQPVPVARAEVVVMAVLKGMA